MTVRPHQTCCNLCVSTIINRLGSHCSNVLALTGTFTDGTKLAPYLIISIFSYPKKIKKEFLACLLAYYLDDTCLKIFLSNSNFNKLF
jgi:hypothetical protein